jgi:hypothetical protein
MKNYDTQEGRNQALPCICSTQPKKKIIDAKKNEIEWVMLEKPIVIFTSRDQ